MSMRYLKFLLINVIIIFLVSNLWAQKEDCNTKTVKVCPDTIIGLTQYMKDTIKLNQLIRDLENTPVEIQELPIQNEFDNFLNTRDTSVFNTDFINSPEQEIHPRSLDYYLLIKNIHDLNYLLTSISNKNIGQLGQIKTDIEKAKLLIDTINTYATEEKRRVSDFMTEEQKQYYRYLVDDYNELFNQIYPIE